MFRVLIRIAIAVLVTRTPASLPAQEFALHDGDRVVFYGDSITAQRLYTRFVEDAVLTRCPALRVQFWNAGVPGDTAYGGYTGDVPARLARDVFPHRPTVVTIMLGMNDGYYMPFNQKYLDIFKEGYLKLDAAIAAGTPPARVTLISPTPYDEVTHGTEFAHYNEVISRNAQFVSELAATSHFAFSDFNRDVTTLLNSGKAKNPSLAALLISDRIHPAEVTQWVMAMSLLRSWRLPPVVSKVSIHAATLRSADAENTQVASVVLDDGKLRWVQTDRSLPLPLPLYNGMMQFVLASSDLEAIDLQMLEIDGLPAPRYTLRIDGNQVVSLTREQWSAGVNLALYATPMENQARSVDDLELKRMKLDEARFILSIEDAKSADAPDAARIIDKKDAALVAEQRNMTQPKSHRYELSPE